MARLAISELTTLRWSLEDDIEHYQAAGVAAIGVWRPKLADLGNDKGAELLAEAELAVSSLQWAGGFTGSDGRSHQDSLSDARLAIQTAATLSAARIPGVGIGGMRMRPSASSSRVTRRFSRMSLLKPSIQIR